MRVTLVLPSAVHAALLAHLLPPGSTGEEEAAFVFARVNVTEAELVFDYVEWLPIPAEGFAHRSAYYLELTDETRAGLIKRAHDLGAALVEFHSHPYPYPAEFSPSDRAGFEEFVPHVRWRLKGRPYAAVVVAPGSFDGLAWVAQAKTPQVLDTILVGDQLHRPSGLTLMNVRHRHA